MFVNRDVMTVVRDKMDFRVYILCRFKRTYMKTC